MNNHPPQLRRAWGLDGDSAEATPADLAAAAPRMLAMLRELEYASGDDYPYCYCAFCAAKPGEPHGEEVYGNGPCRLGTLLAEFSASSTG